MPSQSARARRDQRSEEFKGEVPQSTRGPRGKRERPRDLKRETQFASKRAAWSCQMATTQMVAIEIAQQTGA
eukprot:5427321-Amphidinium_carterae.1